MDNLSRINFQILPKQRKKFKLKCIKEGKSIRKVLESFIERWLKGEIQCK